MGDEGARTDFLTEKIAATGSVEVAKISNKQANSKPTTAPSLRMLTECKQISLHQEADTVPFTTQKPVLKDGQAGFGDPVDPCQARPRDAPAGPCAGQGQGGLCWNGLLHCRRWPRCPGILADGRRDPQRCIDPDALNDGGPGGAARPGCSIRSCCRRAGCTGWIMGYKHRVSRQAQGVPHDSTRKHRNRIGSHLLQGPCLRAGWPELVEHRRQTAVPCRTCAARSRSWTSGPSAASTACTSSTSCARWRRSTRDVLVTVGVHSPKFEHEADPVALAAAVERYGVHHPVLDDPELVTWQAVRGPGLADPGGRRPRGLHRRPPLRRGPRQRHGIADRGAGRRARRQRGPCTAGTGPTWRPRRARATCASPARRLRWTTGTSWSAIRVTTASSSWATTFQPWCAPSARASRASPTATRRAPSSTNLRG